MDMGTAMVIVAGIGAWYSLKSKGIHPLRPRSMGDKPESETGPFTGTQRETEL